MAYPVTGGQLIVNKVKPKQSFMQVSYQYT